MAAAAAAVLPVAACGGRQSVALPQTQTEQPADPAPETPPPATEPQIETVSYFAVTSAGVNIRSGAGTDYGVRGRAEKSTLYALGGSDGDWYKTEWRNGAAYVSKKYCTPVHMPASGNPAAEAVIAEGTKLLGTPYVYGAVRLHDGKGNFYGAFDAGKFDCSSLMQYIFYRGAGVLLDVNTRTQVLQGERVEEDGIERGDLLFFTNDSRKNNRGLERIGHVGLYLGGNYILHTASDYAKIEQISAKRWSYFIEARRMY